MSLQVLLHGVTTLKAKEFLYYYHYYYHYIGESLNKCWGYVTDKCDSYQINTYMVMNPCNNFI